MVEFASVFWSVIGDYLSLLYRMQIIPGVSFGSVLMFCFVVCVLAFLFPYRK